MAYTVKALRKSQHQTDQLLNFFALPLQPRTAAIQNKQCSSKNGKKT